jgi:hypothetical protein
VTNANDSGAGSLRRACEASGPRIAHIRTDGDVDALSEIEVTDDDLTIWNDSYDFTLSGEGIQFNASNIICRGLRVLPGENVGNPEVSSCFTTRTGKSNIVLDHCSGMIAVDENYDLSGDLITVSDCISVLALSNSVHPEGEHSKGISCDVPGSLTLYRTLMAHNASRNPLINQGIVEMVNCVIYNTGGGAAVALVPVSNDITAYLIGNRFVDGPDNPEFTYLVQHTSSSFIVTGYLKNNISASRPTSDDPETDAAHPTNRASFSAYVGSSPNALSEMSAAEALAYVQAGNVGPPVLNAIELQVIADIDAGSGGIIDDPSEVGFAAKYSAP